MCQEGLHWGKQVSEMYEEMCQDGLYWDKQVSEVYVKKWEAWRRELYH